MSARQRYGGSGEDVAGTVRRLALRWEVVPQPVIGGTVEHPLRVDLALLHPARGVALVDLAPRATAHAVASLRRSLDAAGVQARHPGLLPIVYCCLAPEEVPVLPRLLDAAFATQRPLAMADPGWPATVRGVLAGGGPGRAAEAPVGPSVGRRTRPGRLARIGAALVLPLAAVGALAVGIARLPPPPPRETPADAPWPPREMGADASPRTGPTVEQARVSPDAEPVRGAAAPAPQPEGAGADAPPQPTLGTRAAAVLDDAEEAPPTAPEAASAAEPPPAPERADFGPQEAPGPGGAPLEDVAGRASGPSAPPDDLPSPPTPEGAAPWAAAAAAAGPAPEGAAAQPFARSGGEEPAPPPDAAAGPFAGGGVAAPPVPRQVPVPPPPAPSVAAGLAAVPPEASIPGGSAEPRADAPAEAAVPEAEETASSAAPPPEAVPIGVGLPDPTMPEGAEALRGGVADLPPADPIRPRRTDTGGRGEAPQGPLAALPPPPPAVPAPDRPGERTPSSARSSAAPPSRGAAVEPPAPRQPASPRCAAILARLQLGETPSHADRLHLQTICAPRP